MVTDNYDDIAMPLLDNVTLHSDERITATQSRQFDTVGVGGVALVHPVYAANPIGLSEYVYAHKRGIEQLMTFNNRKSPFDFEPDDILLVPETSVYDAITVLTYKQNTDAKTVPQIVNKTTTDKVEAQASNASIVANRRSTSHVIINQQAGKIIF